MQNVNQNVNAASAQGTVAIDRLAWALAFTEGLIKNLADDQLTALAGGKGNHALWVMGHLAYAEDHLLATLTGKPAVLPASYEKLFLAGSEPVDDASDYPARSELVEAMQSTRKRVVG